MSIKPLENLRKIDQQITYILYLNYFNELFYFELKKTQLLAKFSKMWFIDVLIIYKH